MFKELFEAKPTLDKEMKKILKWVDEILGDLTEAIISKSGLHQGTFKEILSMELSKFKTIKKFYTLDNKLAIDGKLKSGDKVIKQIPYPDLDLQVRKDILTALNVRIKPKFQ
ncbi:MAG: hypothetical protein J7L15_05710 [Clostridiales bacterium]|nr:hypothetical protein [Clostridiales bacterium]